MLGAALLLTLSTAGFPHGVRRNCFIQGRQEQSSAALPDSEPAFISGKTRSGGVFACEYRFPKEIAINSCLHPPLTSYHLRRLRSPWARRKQIAGLSFLRQCGGKFIFKRRSCHPGRRPNRVPPRSELRPRVQNRVSRARSRAVDSAPDGCYSFLLPKVYSIYPRLSTLFFAQ